MWLSNPSFLGIVRDAWSNSPFLNQVLSTFFDKVNIWNRIVIGNLFQRNRRILARLKGIQESLSIRPNDFLVELDRNLRLEYADVIRLEEEF